MKWKELKELKKIEQKPVWSDEDEYQINTILHGLDLKREIYRKEGNKVEEDRYNTQYNWLKSLKERYTWKPSEHELEVLRLVAEKDGTCLMGLYKQLKKLMEE